MVDFVNGGSNGHMHLENLSTHRIQVILICFRTKLDSLETANNKSKSYADRIRRVADPYQMFAFARRKDPVQVFTLLCWALVVVEEVHGFDASVSVIAQHQWLPGRI